VTAEGREPEPAEKGLGPTNKRGSPGTLYVTTIDVRSRRLRGAVDWW
jgi:hypothetical protein